MQHKAVRSRAFLLAAAHAVKSKVNMQENYTSSPKYMRLISAGSSAEALQSSRIVMSCKNDAAGVYPGSADV